MTVYIGGQVGPVSPSAGDGLHLDARYEKSGAMVVQELHGRFHEQTYRNNLFAGGMGLTSISAATFTTGTLGATCTPIAGIWNPLGSPVNAVVLQVLLGVTCTALQQTGPGCFVWAVSTGNTLANIGTGGRGFNRKTLTQGGSFAQNMAGAALTNQTNALVVAFGSALSGGCAGNTSQLQTAINFAQTNIPSGTESFDGSFIVPPGAMIALLCTTTPVAYSATSSLVWEEVPL